MTDTELKQQFEQCQLMNDPAQWDALAMAYYYRGYVDNAARCFRKADDIRGCSFSESMPAEMAEA